LCRNAEKTQLRRCGGFTTIHGPQGTPNPERADASRFGVTVPSGRIDIVGGVGADRAGHKVNGAIAVKCIDATSVIAGCGVIPVFPTGVEIAVIARR